MPRRVPFFVAVVLLVTLVWGVGFAGAPERQPVLHAAQLPSGMYQVAPASNTEAWRIDVRTGEVWVCRSPGTEVVCYQSTHGPLPESAYQISARGAGAAWRVDTTTGQLWNCRAPGTEVVCYSERSSVG